MAVDAVECNHCGEEAKLVGGSMIYPSRQDLHSKKFWLCMHCGAYVGCHPPSSAQGRGGCVPLGLLANEEERKARMLAHTYFDQIWKDRLMKRGEAYSWMAGVLGLKEFHIGTSNVAICNEVVRVVTEWRKAHGQVLQNARTRPLRWRVAEGAREQVPYGTGECAL